MCGQFGGSGWRFDALRNVSAGLACKDGKIGRRSLDRRSLRKRAFGWYIGQDDSSWGSDNDDENPLDPIIAAIDTLINTVPRLATDKTSSQSGYVPGHTNSGSWYQPYKLLKRKLGWWISSSLPSNEVPSNPLVTITDKLKKLDSTLDWTINDLAASKSGKPNKSYKRSSGWWLSYGGDGSTDDKSYSTADKTKNDTDRDPLDDILWQVDDLSSKFDKLLALIGSDKKWKVKRSWGFFGQYGKDDMNKEVAKGQLGDPFEPILSKLKGYIKIVQGFLPGGSAQPHVGGYAAQRPKYPWDRKSGLSRRQTEHGAAGDDVGDEGDFENFLEHIHGGTKDQHDKDDSEQSSGPSSSKPSSKSATRPNAPNSPTESNRTSGKFAHASIGRVDGVDADNEVASC